MKNELKNKNFYVLMIFLYLVSLVYVKEINFLFYNTTDSPDFTKYFNFLEFNVNLVNSTTSEQGFLFYDLHSLYFYFKFYNLTQTNFFIFLSKSIQELNFLLFLLGSAGLFKLLKFYKYNDISIITSLIIINFIPISIAQRIVFKPEIMIFALLPWLILSYELFLKSKKIIYLFCSTPILIGIILQKGSAFALISIFLTIFYLKKILLELKNFKKLLIMFIFFIFLIPFYLTLSENTKLNNLDLLDLQSGVMTEAKYNNKGSIDLLYKSKPEELFFYPYKNEHNYSALNITLLDSFGDYFEIYWRNDGSYFSKDQSKIFQFEKSDNTKMPIFDLENNQFTIFTQENENIYYLRNLTSLGVALFFYISFFYFYRKVERPNKKFFLLPLLGYLVLNFHIISGFPENNFDPLVGDTLKPFYYSFFLIITIGFTISEISRTKLRSIFLIAFFIPVLMYTYGFPKNYSEDSIVVLNQINSFSTFCKVNSSVFNFLGDSEIKCEDKESEIRNYNKYKNFSYFEFMPNLHIMNLLIFTFIVFSLFYLSLVKLEP